MGGTRATSTRAFGTGPRENHDSAAFYARFTAPDISDDETVNHALAANTLFCQDARRMEQVADRSVALVVTSPPYFAGKEYEAAMGVGGVPGSYGEYLGLLEEVFGECKRALEPGGRIAVNVANLGRRPFRSLSTDVTTIMQDRLGLLLRGEIVWVKADGAGSSTAWGSYGSAANPVLRDLTERIVVASKGRFDRAPSRAVRRQQGLPHIDTISAEEFRSLTLDVWRLQPESARRIGHPAPFPVELPRRLIELFTFEDDLVLDPFIGSGTTAVAAVRTGRRYVGYDSDPDYIELARRRLEAEKVGAGER